MISLLIHLRTSLKRETFSHLSNHNFRTPGELRIYGSGFRGLAVEGYRGIGVEVKFKATAFIG